MNADCTPTDIFGLGQWTDLDLNELWCILVYLLQTDHVVQHETCSALSDFAGIYTFIMLYS